MKKAIENIVNGAEERVQLIALDLVALISGRVKNKGTTAQGGFFSQYKSTRARKKAGLQISFKDFTFTNTMWRDFDLLGINGSSGVINAEIGFRTKRSSKIYDYNVEKEKIEIIEPSEKELDLASEALLEWIGKQII